MSKPSLSKLEFGALWAYSPRGTNPASRTSQRIVREGIKQLRKPMIQGHRRDVVVRAAEMIEERYLELFEGLFGPERLLVPVPRSAPMQENTVWPSLAICQALQSRGLGRVYPILERTKRVPSSAKSEQRPKWTEHRDTMRCKQTLLPGDEITLVDDVITLGATVLGAAASLLDSHREVTIRAFALARTLGIRRSWGV